ARDRADVVDGDHVGRVGHGDDQATLLPGDGNGLEAPGQGVGDEADGARGDRVLEEVDELEADARRQGGDEIALGDDLLVDQDAASITPADVDTSPPSSARRRTRASAFSGVRAAAASPTRSSAAAWRRRAAASARRERGRARSWAAAGVGRRARRMWAGMET